MTITIPSFTDAGQPPRLEERFPEEDILAAAGRIMSARRTTRSGPAKLEPCPSCGQPTNARVRRVGCYCGHRWPR